MAERKTKYNHYKVNMPMYALEDVAKTLIASNRCPFQGAISLDTAVAGMVMMIQAQLPLLPAQMLAQPGYKRACKLLVELADIVHAGSADNDLDYPRGTGYAIKGVLIEIQSGLMAAAEAVAGEKNMPGAVRSGDFDFDIK